MHNNLQIQLGSAFFSWNSHSCPPKLLVFTGDATKYDLIAVLYAGIFLKEQLVKWSKMQLRASHLCAKTLLTMEAIPTGCFVFHQNPFLALRCVLQIHKN